MKKLQSLNLSAKHIVSFFLLIEVYLITSQQNLYYMESGTSFVPEVTENIAMDSAEKRLNELGYKQELRREMVFVLFAS